MSGDHRWIRVPIGEGAEPYLTVKFARKVLVVARTVTTTVWLLDFLEEVFGDDTRVQVLFTVEDDHPSVYHEGARALLREVGAAVVPWDQARATSFDVVICSTHTGSLEQLRGPLFITPHGPGFGKPASVRPGGSVPLARRLDDSGGYYETTVVLSHASQAALFDQSIDAVRLLVAGDPAYDRLRASVHRRPALRAAFGARESQMLVVHSSTWGPGAQLALLPDLAMRLRAELPVDRAQVAIIIHPNIWFGHGPWQVRAWLRTAREAGVLLVPPRGDEWRAAIVAADVAVVDHGSVGFYAAAIGRPVLRAGFAEEYLMPDAPLRELGSLAPELDLGRPAEAQLRETIDHHDPSRYAAAIERMFESSTNAVGVMRDAIYEQIDLAPPTRQARSLAVSRPEFDLTQVTAHVVTGEVLASRDPERLQVKLARCPAVLDADTGIGHAVELGMTLPRGGGDTSSSTRWKPTPHCSNPQPLCCAATSRPRTPRPTKGGQRGRSPVCLGAAWPRRSATTSRAYSRERAPRSSRDGSRCPTAQATPTTACSRPSPTSSTSPGS